MACFLVRMYIQPIGAGLELMIEDFFGNIDGMK